MSKIILGIDPGSIIMGYGLIESEGKNMKLMLFGDLKLSKYQNDEDKFKKIFFTIDNLIKSYKVDEVAIEAPFFGKNVQSMLKLGRAQGIAIAASLANDISITEYQPKKVKLSVTGNGNASKEQVALMLKSLLKFEKMPENYDATDGLALAVCHHFQFGMKFKSNYSSWKSFINENPNKVN